MSLCIFLVKFNVPSTGTWLGDSFKVVNGVILMVVTRISRRLVLGDRARGCGASGCTEYR